MRYALIALTMASSPALAADCGVYTHETRPPGEITATFDEGARSLVIADRYSDTVAYTLEGAGTGLPFWVAKADGKRDVMVREYEGVLLLDMLAWPAWCD